MKGPHSKLELGRKVRIDRQRPSKSYEAARLGGGKEAFPDSCSHDGEISGLTSRLKWPWRLNIDYRIMGWGAKGKEQLIGTGPLKDAE